MKIIIVGCGKVGYAIARQMEQEKHDIVMVDNEIAHLSRADSTLDVMCVHGSGASISVLMDAGVRSADLVIAVTAQDELNLLCCLIAKKIGAKHTIARVRNPEYAEELPLISDDLGLSLSVSSLSTGCMLERNFIKVPPCFLTPTWASSCSASGF